MQDCILTCWWKPWDSCGLQGRFWSQEFLPLWGLFILVLMGCSNHVSLASRDNLCTLSHRPQSFSFQRGREKNEYARTAAADDELYLRYADNLPEYGAYGSCYALLCSTVFYACLWLGTFRSISHSLSISQTTESDAFKFSSVLLCIFLNK